MRMRNMSISSVADVCFVGRSDVTRRRLRAIAIYK